MSTTLHDSGTSPKSPFFALAEVAFFVVLFLAIDAATLKFVFPHYFDPLWPHHSDYYMPTAIANSPITLGQILALPRPIGMLFFWVIGHAGTRGAMLAVLMVVAANFALIVWLLRQIFDIRFGWKLVLSSSAFAFLVAAHPYQYQMSTWDAFADLALFFLLGATVLFIRGRNWTAAVLVLLACLAKETYVVSALALSGIFALTSARKWVRLLPGLTIAGATVLSFLYEHVVSSPFTTSGDQYGGVYRVNITPSSIWSEWTRYLVEGANLAALCALAISIVIIACVHGWRSRIFLTAVALPIAGAAALLPNALLPNHHFAGYSWDSAYLLYAPIVLLAAPTHYKATALLASVVVAVVSVFSPSLSATAYQSQDWILMNQKRQRTFLQVLGGLIKQIPAENQNILVSGVNFPFSPFYWADSLLALHPPRGTKFFVVAYGGKPVASELKFNSGIVTFITPREIEASRFDQIWLVRNDGTLYSRVAAGETVSNSPLNGFTRDQVLAFPGLLDAFKGPGEPTGYDYMTCGVQLLNYGQPQLAEGCLEKSALLLPKNPYSSFYLGQSLEQQKKIDEARAAYARAVAVQDDSPNPAFEAALKNLH